MLAPGRAPINDAELARSLHDRIRILETATTTRVGGATGWLLSDVEGTLTALKPGVAPITFGALPDFSSEIQKGLSGALAGYVSVQDLAQSLGAIQGVGGGGQTPAALLAQIDAWTKTLLPISELAKAILGIPGDLADLAAWALTVPTMIGDLLDGSLIGGALNMAVTIGGTALSTLVSGGQLAASQIAGAMNTAVTVGGTAFSTLVSGGQLAASQIVGALNNAITVNGTALNTLIPSGQLAAAQIAGAMNLAVTVGGNTLSALFTGGLFNAAQIGNIANIPTIAATNINATVANTTGWLTSVEQQIADGINNGVNALNTTGATIASVATNIGSAITGFFNGFRGPTAAAPAASAVQVYDEITTQLSNIVSMQTDLIDLYSPAIATGLLNATIDFLNYPDSSSMPAEFTVVNWDPAASSGGNATVGIDNGRATWFPGTNTLLFNGKLSIFNTPTTTDYQEVSGIWTGLPSVGSTYSGLAARVDTSGNGIHWAFDVVAQNWRLYKKVAGVITTIAVNSALGTGTFIFKPSAKYTVQAGTPNGIMKVQVLENGAPLPDSTAATEFDATGSALGSSNRLTGEGQYGSTGSGSPPGSVIPNGVPVPMSTFGASDNITNVIKPVEPYGYFIPPPTTGWSSVNAGTTTFVADRDDLLLTAPSIAAGETLHCYVQALSPASNYTKTFYLETIAFPTNTWVIGLVLRNSSTGELVTFEIGVSTAVWATGCFIRSVKWTNTGAVSGTYLFGATAFLSAVPNWFRIRDDATDRYLEYSFNSVDWRIFHQIGRTDFTTPDQIGVCIFNQATGQPATCRIQSMD